MNQNTEATVEGSMNYQANTEKITLALPLPEFKDVRSLNWGLATFFACAFAYQALFTASPAGPALMGLAIVLFSPHLVISAIALSGKDLFVCGLFICIDATRRRRLINVGLVLNWIVLGLGTISVVSAVGTGQIALAILVALFMVMPPVINIRALRKLKQLLHGYTEIASQTA